MKIGPDVFAMSDGYGIGTDDDGRYVEFMTEWGALDSLDGVPETGFLEVPDWAVIAIRD